jgi:hypothetical protein
MLGTLAGADLFEPKYAMIVHNADEVTVPLLLDTIPTPKEFKDAIESLSPEQQRFAKAYRSMQLASTLFAVVTIQVQPMLEAVLNLPPNTLQHEIAMTEPLLKLMLEYSIPPDQLCCRDPRTYSRDETLPSPSQQLGQVRQNVKAMQEVIAAAKRQEQEEARQAEAMRKALLPPAPKQRPTPAPVRREPTVPVTPARVTYFDPPIVPAGGRLLPYARFSKLLPPCSLILAI